MIDDTALVRGIRNLFPVDKNDWCQIRRTEHAARVILSGLIVDIGVGRELKERARAARRRLLQAFIDRAENSRLSPARAAAVAEAKRARHGSDEAQCDRALADLMIAMASDPDCADLIVEAARIDATLQRELHRAYLAETAFSETHEQGAQQVLGPMVDAEQIVRGLADAGIDTAAIEINEIKPVLGGFSRQTLICDLSGADFPDGRLVVRASMGVDYSGAPVEDEYATAVALYRNGVKVPRPIGLSSAGGTARPFMIMEWADGAMLGFTPREPNPSLCRETGFQLGLVHTAPIEDFSHVEGAGISNRDQMLADIEAQEKKWRDAQGSNAVVAYAINWLRDHVDLAEGARSMTHGDYRGHNLLQKDGQLTAILDWEHGRIANPARDFGYSRTFIEAIGGWELFTEGYVEAGGVVPDARAIHYFDVFASLFKTAVLAQIASGYRGEPTQQLATAAAVIHQGPLEMMPLIELLDLA